MKHYEIVFLVHPDQSDQVPSMIEKYKGLVEAANGKVHRIEDWGRRQLAYPIQEVHKAHYTLMNVEAPFAVISEITSLFRFNDAVLRNMVATVPKAVTELSPMAQKKEREKELEKERTTVRREPVALDASDQRQVDRQDRDSKDHYDDDTEVDQEDDNGSSP